MADGRLVVGLLAARGAGSVRAGASVLAAPLRAFRLRRTGRLLLAPPDLRTADPTVAAEVYGGYFAFAGRTVQAGGLSPFALHPPSRDWAEALTGFSWLRHLRAADTALARANARALVGEFLTERPPSAGDPAWGTRVVARRLVSWLTQSPLLLEGADHGAYARLLRAIARHARILAARLGAGAEPEARLPAGIALAYAGLCAEGLEGALGLGTRVLERELGRAILPDGGHATRDPALLVDLLYDLLPLRRSFAARDLAPPKTLLAAVDRMTPALRLFRHADGSLAAFNGAGSVPREALTTLFLYDETRGAVPEGLPASGYARLSAGGLALVADVGRPPPPRLSGRAGAGCLAFELSAPGGRLIVNCGAPGSEAGEEARQAARLTPAHSTLTFDGASSCRFAEGRLGARLGKPIIKGPGRVTAKRADDGGALVLDASHDGYAARFGLVHHRRLALARDGSRLDGRDALRPAQGRVNGEGGPRAYALRFHLAPEVRAAEEGGTAVLTTPAGETWRFAAEGRAVEVADSVAFAALGGSRRTRQLVVAATWPETAEVGWSLVREG